MRLFAPQLIVTLAVGFYSLLAQAVDSTITITGKVTANPCTVSTVLASGQTVDLGTQGRVRLQQASDLGEWKSFALNLTNCPLITKQATVTFSGKPDGTNATLFANTAPTAVAASGIAVQMAKDTDHSALLSAGSTMTVDIDSLTRTATFPLAARMYASTGEVQAGQVSSSVLVNFTYQ